MLESEPLDYVVTCSGTRTDEPLGVHHAMPGNSAATGQRAEGVADKTRLTGNASQASYLTVSSDAPARNARDDCVHLRVCAAWADHNGAASATVDRPACTTESTMARTMAGMRERTTARTPARSSDDTMDRSSKSSAVPVQHLQGDCGKFRQSDSACVFLAIVAIASGAARRAVERQRSNPSVGPRALRQPSGDLQRVLIVHLL